MPALHVRDVPESVLAALKERASRHGHSVQQEVRGILAAAAAERPPARQVEPLRLHTVSTGQTGTWTREEMYGDDGR